MIITLRHPPMGFEWTDKVAQTAVGRPFKSAPIDGNQIGTIVAARVAEDGALELDVELDPGGVEIVQDQVRQVSVYPSLRVPGED